MKKIALSVLSVVCAVCMMFGFMTMANVNNIASADTTVELSATAIKKSVNKDKMLNKYRNIRARIFRTATLDHHIRLGAEQTQGRPSSSYE